MFWSKVETRGGRPNEQVNRIKTITRICKNHIFKRRHAAALPQFFTYTVSQLHSTHRGGSWSTDIQDGACQRSTLRSSLSQVTSFFFFFSSSEPHKSSLWPRDLIVTERAQRCWTVWPVLAGIPSWASRLCWLNAKPTTDREPSWLGEGHPMRH